MNAIVRGLIRHVGIALLIVFAVSGPVSAQSSSDQNPATTNSTPETVDALRLELTNAWHQVETIVCQPVAAFRRDPGYDVSVYGPGGWFHPGAMTPDFNSVDVRKSQELPYAAHPWVSSDITPNMMFRGSDLEFNSMTKLFYTNRSLPKKRLSEAEMLQINSLYRTIGHCQSVIARLQNPPSAEAPAPAGTPAAADSTADDTQSDTNDAAPAPGIAAIERIPKQTRILYGSIAIGTLILVVVSLRLVKKKSD
jgi:hypothetical protein